MGQVLSAVLGPKQISGVISFPIFERQSRCLSGMVGTWWRLEQESLIVHWILFSNMFLQGLEKFDFNQNETRDDQTALRIDTEIISLNMNSTMMIEI